MHVDRDWELRLAAFEHLNRLRERSGGVVRTQDLEDGFDLGGERIPLFNRQRGIWRPRQLGKDGAVLSITTTPPRPGKKAPYDDQVASDEGSFAYRYEGDDPNRWSNRSVRRAGEVERPFIYFYGIAPGLYEAIYPVYLVGDDPANLTFHVALDQLAGLALETAGTGLTTEIRRAYATRETKQRLHQHRFREMVLHAYSGRCSVCRIRHAVLLDAAHILPDRDERGRPEVPNGLAMCKIHHAAFDAHILGIDPERVIHIRHDILKERDGPMLQHGLKEMDGTNLSVPRAASLQPRGEYLVVRYERFLAA